MAGLPWLLESSSVIVLAIVDKLLTTYSEVDSHVLSAHGFLVSDEFLANPLS
jgi:hypothetical protein